MQVQVFGGLRATQGGRAIDLGRPKQRLLFAILVVEAGQVVPSERLLDLLWEDDSSRARSALHAYVSNLRKAIGGGPLDPQPLVREGGGYRLAVGAADVDAARFESLVDAGRRAVAGSDDALTAYEGALDLWTGPPLPDLIDIPVVVAARRRWSGLRAAAVEGAAEARLARGDPAAAVGWCEPLLDEHPLRERLQALAAEALYRVGRQADALRVIDGTRRALAETSGLEPTEVLRSLEQRILDHDPDLAGPEPRARAHPGAGPTTQPVQAGAPLYGRETELDHLASMPPDLGGLVLIAGDAGSGRTALARAVVGRLGRRAAWTRCPESMATPPLWPLADLTDQLGRAASGDRPDAAASTRGGSDPFLAARAVFDAWQQSPDRPVAVIDDLQWADADTRRVVAHLVGDLSAGCVLLVVTLRPPAAGESEELVTLRAELARQADRSITLAGLSIEAVGAWLAARLGPGGSLLAGDVHARTGGDALFVREVVELLAAQQSLGGSFEDALRAVPPGVRAVVRRRVSQLPATTQRLLSAASVIDDAFAIDVVAEVAGVGARAALSDLAAAVEAGALIQETQTTVRFTNALVRDALAAELNDVRRAEHHAAVARALARRHPAADMASLVAHHAARGMLAGTAALAASAGRDAAALASARNAPADAARWRQVVVTAVEHMAPHDPQALAGALLDAAAAHEQADQMPAAQAAVTRLLTLDRAAPDPDRLATAAGILCHASIFPNRTYGEVDDELVALLEDALDTVETGSSDIRATLLSALVTELAHRRSDAGRKRLADEAVDLARRSPSSAVLVRALHARSFALKGPAGAVDRLADAIEIAAIVDKDGLRSELALLARIQIALGELTLGRLASLPQLLAALEPLVDQPVGVALRSQALLLRAHVDALTGRYVAAGDGVARAHHVLRPARPAEAGAILFAQRLMLANDLGGAEPLLDAIPVGPEAAGYALPLQLFGAVVRFELGQPEGAQALVPLPLRELLDRPDDYQSTFVDVAAATIAVETADDSVAPRLLARLDPLRGRWAYAGTGAGSLGYVDLAVARLSDLVGDRESAATAFADAVAHHERAMTPAWLARTLLHQGRFLMAEDPGAARGALERATAIASTHGLDPVTAAIDRILG